MGDDPKSGKPKLVELAKFQRFVPTDRYRCPQCGGSALQDNWPPNYAGGTLSPRRTEACSRIKHVCLSCRIAFQVNCVRLFENGQERETLEVSGIVPLVERDGLLLTPHDMQVFTHFAEHGFWPTRAYP